MLAKVLTNFQTANQADGEGMGTAGGILGLVWYDTYIQFDFCCDMVHIKISKHKIKVLHTLKPIVTHNNDIKIMS